MKTIFLLLLTICTAFAASPVSGTWNGTLDNGSDVLRLALNITEEGGKLSAFVTNLENSQRIPVASVKFEDNAIELNIAAQNGVYKGGVDGDDIKGQWTQGTNTLPLNFKRADGAAVVSLVWDGGAAFRRDRLP